MGRAVELEESAPGENAGGDRLRALEDELFRAGREVERLSGEIDALRARLIRERSAREELMDVVTHEVRTPVTVIGGFTRLLLAEEAGPLTREQRRFLEESRKSCGRLDRFIERVLACSRDVEPEALERRQGSLASVVEEVVQSLRALVSERRIELVQKVDPGHVAWFDAGAVERVLMNLMGNAARFARTSIEVATREVERGGRLQIEVSVADDGPGVPEAQRQRIFEPYVQVAGGQGGGLGLGLAICRRLVEAHGGRIGVGPWEGGGARFFFTLPRSGGA